ncbi:Zinc/iron permease [Syncephalastrum racemosum]|uniref:Zinc/iron permease n=1 Tax=Syncephalastrum racemosum TaxID=13706 RepID=A0A1X2H6N2_SYNRA|nr:Zinc/iron permease [Syncephalastrum racemosum]
MSSLQATAFAYLFPGSPMVNSLLATAYISIFPNLLLYFVPPDIDTSSLNVLVSFAVGGLLGDVFLHLLPHAFLGEHVEDHAAVAVDEQKNVLIGLGIFGGFFFFFVMDKLMRVFNGGSGHDHHHHQHGVDTKKHDDHDSAVEHEHEHEHNHNEDEGGLRQRKKAAEEKNQEEKSVEKKKQQSSEEGIKLSAYLNLFADFTHNMTDGLAMAASFYASPSVGATTAVAVFFHEIPHEVGDYAILIQSGFSKQRAMLAQFTTAVGAFLGTIIGICIEQMAKAEVKDHPVPGILGTDLRWGDLVIPFTAGGFMYIATVGVVPELLEVTGKIVKDRRQALSEFAAMLVGVSLMGVIAWNEGSA